MLQKKQPWKEYCSSKYNKKCTMDVYRMVYQYLFIDIHVLIVIVYRSVSTI